MVLGTVDKSEIEICQLVHCSTTRAGRVFYWWEARQLTAEGEIVLAISQKYESAEWAALNVPSKNLIEKLKWWVNGREVLSSQGMLHDIHKERETHGELVTTLNASGWEIAGIDPQGLIAAMKRDCKH